MVRRAEEEDIARIMEIWLKSNLEAHDFIQESYWKDNYDSVRKILPQAKLYVWEDSRGIQGFAGLEEDYLAGIFVDSQVRSKGVGKQLLEEIKKTYKRLTLHVYGKNKGAIRFYLREGFIIKQKQKDEYTKETEFLMEYNV